MTSVKSSSRNRLFNFATKSEILASIPYAFSHKINSTYSNEFNVDLLEITVNLGDFHTPLQPIIIGDVSDIAKLSKCFWGKVLQSWEQKEETASNKNVYSLKSNVLIPELASLIPQYPGKVLDVGSFDGSISENSLKNCSDYQLFSFDFIQPLLKKIKSHTKPFFVSDSSSIALKKESIDTVLCSMSLLNFISIEGALKEIDRILKKDGLLIIADINSNYYKATGIHIKKNNCWSFIKIISLDKIFFTLKRMSKNITTVHCFHPYNLYTNFLIDSGYCIQEDYSTGPTVERIIESIHDPRRQKITIEKNGRDIACPCFHMIKAKKCLTKN